MCARALLRKTGAQRLFYYVKHEQEEYIIRELSIFTGLYVFLIE